MAYPACLLVICGDDDRDTEAKTGNNPGRTKATAAARAVQAKLRALASGAPKRTEEVGVATQAPPE